MSDLISLLDATLRLISNNGTERRLWKTTPSLVKPGGYPSDIFLPKPPKEELERLECGICFLVCKNPCHCVNKHQFCRSCVTVWSGSGNSENHNKCPVCRVSGYYLPSGTVADDLNCRQVRCLLRSCIWVGQLKNIHNHRHVLNKKIHHEDNYNLITKPCDNNNDNNNNNLNIGLRCSEINERILPKEPSSAASLLQRIRNEQKDTLLSSQNVSNQPTLTANPTQLSPSLMLLNAGINSSDRSLTRNAISSGRSLPVTPTTYYNNNSLIRQRQQPTFDNHVNQRTDESIENVLRSFLPASSSNTQSSVSHPNDNNNNINYNTLSRSAFVGSTSPQPSLPLASDTDSHTGNNSNNIGPIHHRSVNRRTGPKEYERLRARMRETRLRLEQMEITRRELACFQERQRLQHLVEVRELGRQLNEVTFQIRRLLNQMSTNENPSHNQLVK
ncbi:bromodomain-containing protein DDB_G0280777-like [Argonauta hians]